ncbi:uncharacterized protein LOC124278466 [Haliotis rubra]|uniref:uncharacterized protein LOC124278466 n=1 Tax=Haliotis rubra TaxID=36100 RepID=UPI001EE54255|nr:uncharacterized protein LOC124278466 [Haliotis rubra]
MLCTEKGQEEILKFLVSHDASLSVKTFGEGADLSFADDKGRDCLMYACETEEADLSLSDNKGRDCLMYACEREGADLSLTDKTGGDCLVYACQRGQRLSDVGV